VNLTFAFSALAFLAASPASSQAVKVDGAVPVYKKVDGVSGSIKSVGSDTMLNLVTFWADDFKKLYPGVTSPLRQSHGIDCDIDFLVVREGTEGPYVGNGGVVREGGPHEIATEVSINTAYGVERVVRDAFGRAAARPRKHLTLVHKTNVLVHAGALWARTVAQVGEEFPDVTTDYLHVDAASIFMVTQPERFDVIVTDNLFGDIVTDLAAAITGGIGLAASGNLDMSRTNPSMFEPVHGSAPDIAGTGTADPTATILSVAMLLDHVGLGEAGAAVEAAVVADLAERGDSRRSTRAVGDAVLARL